MAALQKNGEDGWKNRVKKESKDVNSNVTLRPKVSYLIDCIADKCIDLVYNYLLSFVIFLLKKFLVLARH